jgi:hypothetical protein
MSNSDNAVIRTIRCHPVFVAGVLMLHISLGMTFSLLLDEYVIALLPVSMNIFTVMWLGLSVMTMFSSSLDTILGADF